MDAIAAAIAAPARRDILELLHDSPQTAGELAGAFEISRPAVSRHLRVLREAGLVASEPRGRRRVYTLQIAPLTELEQWLSRIAHDWNQHLDALETEVYRTRRERRDPPTPKEHTA